PRASLRTYEVLCDRLDGLRLQYAERAAWTPTVTALATRLFRGADVSRAGHVVFRALTVTDPIADPPLIAVLRQRPAATPGAIRKEVHGGRYDYRYRQTLGWTEESDRRWTRVILGIADLIESDRQLLPTELRGRRLTDDERNRTAAYLSAKPISYLAWTLIDD